MDKDKTIKELNEINRQLAKDLDKSRASNDQLLSDIRRTCVRDVISLPGYLKPNEPDNSNVNLTLSKSFGNG